MLSGFKNAESKDAVVLGIAFGVQGQKDKNNCEPFPIMDLPNEILDLIFESVLEAVASLHQPQLANFNE